MAGTKTKLCKWYSATNKLLCGIVVNRIKARIERDMAASAKKEEREKRYLQETEEGQQDMIPDNNIIASENPPILASENVLPSDNFPPSDRPGMDNVDAAMSSHPEISKEPEGLNERVNSKGEEIQQVKDRIELDKLRSLKLTQSESEDEDNFADLQKESISWPKHPGFWNKVARVILYPVNLMLYFTIPTPRIARDKEPNYLPLIFTLCLIWMGIFAYLITWWLVALSIAFDLPFLVLPMFLLPAGLFLRDFPHWLEFRKRIVQLENKAKADAEKSSEDDKKKSSSTRQFYDKSTTKSDQTEYKERIPEYYSGPIFTFTMGTSLTWLLYTLIQGKIKLTSDRIFEQILLLAGIVISKIILIVISGFTTPKWLFYAHMVIYSIYLIIVLVIEFTV